MPSYTQIPGDSDAEVVIYQPSMDTLWEFWALRESSGSYTACWGGRMQDVSSNPGIWSGGYGATATGLPLIGGQITAEELQRGEIDHVMGIALVETANWDVVSWPAQRSDGWNMGTPGVGLIAEGQRMRLDPTIDVDSLDISPVAKTVAKAAQIYGFVVWDRAGSIAIRTQNGLTYTALGQPDPYPDLYGGVAGYQILDGFPWDQLLFLPMGYGQP